MFQIKINTQLLKETVNLAKQATASTNVLPILSTIKLKATEKALGISSSNSHVSLAQVVPATDELTILDTGEICIAIALFAKLVNNLPGEETLLSESEHNRLAIESGPFKTTLAGKAGDEYPRFPDIDSKTQFELNKQDLLTLIESTAPFTAKEESRPILTGVHFVAKDGKLTATATDAHTMSRRSLTCDTTIQLDVVIPRENLLKLVNLLKGTKTDTIIIRYTNIGLQIVADSRFIYLRSLEGAYPETDRLIPTEHEVKLTANTHLLKQAFKRAALISSTIANEPVDLVITKDNLTLSTQTELNQTNEALALGTEDDETATIKEITMPSLNELRISFNCSWIGLLLEHIHTETVNLGFTSPVRPVKIEGVGDEDYVQILTPIKTTR